MHHACWPPCFHCYQIIPDADSGVVTEQHAGLIFALGEFHCQSRHCCYCCYTESMVQIFRQIRQAEIMNVLASRYLHWAVRHCDYSNQGIQSSATKYKQQKLNLITLESLKHVTKKLALFSRTSVFDKKAQLSLTNPLDAWNPGHGSFKGIESDTKLIRQLAYGFLLA